MNLGRSLAIFDMDGTLIDSMRVWRRLNVRYFTERGIAMPESLEGRTDFIGTRECANAYIREYGLTVAAGDVSLACEERMRTEYLSVPEKPGAGAYLAALKRAGVRMCVATYTPRDIALVALQARGMLPYFEKVVTPDEMGIDKKDPAFFLTLTRMLGVEPSDAVMYEDTPDVMRAAREAGLAVIGVEEYVWQHHQETARALSDRYIRDFSQMLA